MDRRRLSIGLVLEISVVAFEALSVATIAPKVARDLGGVELYGWTFAGFMLANLVSVVLAGHASDRHGPAAPFSVGLVLFVVGLVACGAAPTMPILIAGRVIQGLGAGTIGATAFVAIGRAFEEHERARQFALLSTAWVVPGLVAPALAGIIASEVGWRFVFFGLIPLPLIAAWLTLPVLRHLKSGPQMTEGVLPVGAAVQLAVGAGLLVAGLGTEDVAIAAPLAVVGVAVAIPAFVHLTPSGTLLGQALGTGLAGAIVAVAATGGGARRDALGVVFALMLVAALLGTLTARRLPSDPAGLRDAAVRSAS